MGARARGFLKAIALTAGGTGILSLATAAAGGRRAFDRRTPRGRGDGPQRYAYISPRARGRGVPPAPSREPARGDDGRTGRVRTLGDLGHVLGVEVPRYPVLGLEELAELVRRYRPDVGERALRIYAAWADGESGLNPNVVGDVEWALLHPDLYRANVLESRTYAANPWREERRAWIAFGYFHLLSPGMLATAIARGLVPASSPPWALADPAVSLPIGLDMIDRLLAASARFGWPETYVRARLAAKGCGADGRLCRPDTVRAVRARALRYLDKWEILSPP